MRWVEWADDRRRDLESVGRRRVVRDFDARGPRGLLGEEQVVSFASNDYLGLTAHPAVVAAAREALERWGSGAGAARLIVGSRPVHSRLEAEIARWKGVEAALLFPTGYAANLGVLTALADRNTLVCSDELNHASIIDGCRLARADVAVYPHGDVSALGRLLRAAPRALVATESVFSMDGDAAPVSEVASLCARHGALLVVDEAHAVLGPDPDFGEADVLRVGTLSKFLGAVGGFVAGPEALVDVLRSTARSFIFTTASSPADAAAALQALRILQSEEGRSLVARLATLVARVAPGRRSPILPVILGSEEAALAAARRLLGRGLLVPAIRPPSVPVGTARLRVTLSAAHTDAEVAALCDALAALEPARV